jgi:hypothetical protein
MELSELPEDLSGEHNRRQRERVAAHLVQRRRGDLTTYMATETPFPTRESAEDTYELDPKYRAFLDRVVDFCRESVRAPGSDGRRQRIRWWSALALLRALASSPRAAAATLRNRAAHADPETLDAVDAEGRRAVLDLDDESREAIDVAPGVAGDPDPSQGRRLLDLARAAEELVGKHDRKLRRLEAILEKLLADGFAPIVFCRFIPTVEYVTENLAKKLKRTTVMAVTGELAPEEREARVAELGKAERRVLVCTDCLSEGINLQDEFSAVVHYDLAWNPTRHEQREGRVDRYGQKCPTVRALTFYGKDNPVDGIVLEVLLRKHARIRDATGVSVPVPGESDWVGRAIMEGLVLRGEKPASQLGLASLSNDWMAMLEPAQHQVDVEWNAAADREKKNRTLFAHHQTQKALHDDLVVELAEVRRAVGDAADVQRFTTNALAAVGAHVAAGPPLDADLSSCRAAVRDALGQRERVLGVFAGRVPDGGELLVRTHPVVDGLSRFVVESALDAAVPGPGRRCGVIRTRDVATRTVLLLLRIRYHLVGTDKRERPVALLAEDVALAAFTGTPAAPIWLDDPDALLGARPHGNIDAAAARDHLRSALTGLAGIQAAISGIGRGRAGALLEAHRRVRRVARGGARTRSAEVLPPIDVVGTYVYLPAGGGV